MSATKVLIIDDEVEVSSLISGVLEDEGYITYCADNDLDAINLLKKNDPDVVFLDLWMHDDESAGLKILSKIKKINNEVPVIIISGHGTIDLAVSTIHKGAFDFIEKPFVIDRLLMVCEKAAEIYSLKRENLSLKTKAIDTEVFSVGASAFATNIKSNIEKIASTSSRVFIKADDGSGAELIALWMHKNSKRTGAFVVCNCLYDNDDKLDEELFGTEKSYGCLERAHNGTLFISNVTNLTQSLQKKLLQFLSEGKITVDSRIVYSDTRIITNASYAAYEFATENEYFSNELLYRLNIINLEIPSLKNRREDIKHIINYYLARAEQFFGIKKRMLNDGVFAILESYDWPGNLIQLKNVIENTLINALCASNDIVIEDYLPQEVMKSTREKYGALDVARLISLPLKEAKELFESDYLAAQIERFSGNITQTANFIGMDRSALHKKLKSLNIVINKKNR